MKFFSISNLIKGAVVCLIIIGLNASMFRIIWFTANRGARTVMGGIINTANNNSFLNNKKLDVQPDEGYVERFLRPSVSKEMEKKYTFNKNGQMITDKFILPSDVVRAYFDILSDASNMGEKKGGCGSIGFGDIPYPAAYELLSQGLKRNMAYEKFLQSFKGIGHISLIKFIEVPSVKNGDEIFARFFVEIETIEGTDTEGKTCFAYYYGYVTAGQDRDKRWKITGIELNPEDFLCHAYHGWAHEGTAIVKIIYGEECNIIDKVLNVEEDGYLRNITAKGKDGKQYRFVFVRITNGADIELRQFVMVEGKWKDIYIEVEKYKKKD